MKASKIIFLVSLLFSCFCIGCSKKNLCSNNKVYLEVANSYIIFDFFDTTTGGYLIKENTSKYSKNEVFLFNDNSEQLKVFFTLNLVQLLND